MDFSGEPETRELKRAHHNALERKRRDHIKESFNVLRAQIPTLGGEKASRAAILNTAREYIQDTRADNLQIESDIEDLKRQNEFLENQIKMLEMKSAGQ